MDLILKKQADKRKIPYLPKDIVNGLEFFLELSEIENGLKKIYDQNANVSREDIMRFLRNQEKHPIQIKSELNASDIFKEGYNIHVIRHLRYLPGFAHKHDFFEMMTVIKGEAVCMIQQKEFLLHEGDLIILPPNIKHEILMMKENDLCINILIKKEAFNNSFLHLMDEKNVLSLLFNQVFYGENGMFLLFHTGNDKQISENMFVIYSEYLLEPRYNNYMLEAILSSFLIILLRYHEKGAIIENASSEQQNEDIILIMNYIQSQYPIVTLKELSQFFSYSERQMARIIERYTGKKFKELLQEVRLSNVERMLLVSDKNVTEIAEEAGYNDMKNFYEKFKNRNHCTPGEYRKLEMSENPK